MVTNGGITRGQRWCSNTAVLSPLQAFFSFDAILRSLRIYKVKQEGPIFIIRIFIVSDVYNAVPLARREVSQICFLVLTNMLPVSLSVRYSFDAQYSAQ